MARRRLERGVKLNHPEAVALITDFVVEDARDGRSVADQVMDGTAEMLHDVQVGSHCHFFEANPALSFERGKARGFRLDIPAGTVKRFEPGQTREVYGFRQEVMSKL